MPPATDVLGVLIRVVSAVVPHSASADDLQRLERCLDVVHKRLQGHEALEMDPRSAAEDAKRLAVSLRTKITHVLPCLKDDNLMSRAARLIVRVNDEVDPYTRALSQVNHPRLAEYLTPLLTDSCSS